MKNFGIIGLLSMLLVGCDDVQVGVVDEGFMIVDDGLGGELELHPGELPHVVTWNPEIEDETVVPEAVARVNGWLGVEAFTLGGEGMPPATVVCDAGFVPGGAEGYWSSYYGNGAESLEWMRVYYDEEGTIYEAYVLLNIDFAYDHDTSVMAICHALLHVLGLADDPGPPTTVDLRSAMSDPLDPLGVLTAADLERLQPYLL